MIAKNITNEHEMMHTPSNMKDTTAEAIEHLYAAFSDADKPHFVEGCPCCLDRKEVGDLLRAPLRTIQPDEIASYAWSLFLTVGNETDFRYFLPRIFEISVIERWWSPDPEVVMGKLRYVSWRDWDSLKVAAIESFMDAVFDEFVLEGTDVASTWLCALAHGGSDFERMLMRIACSEHALITIYEANSQALQKGKLSNGFWNDIPQHKNRLIEWFGTKETAHRVADAYEKLHAT